MSASLKLAKQYFAYSNQSDMTRIAALFSDNSTYYSSNLGFFIGKGPIITMQTAFHAQYQRLKWTIDQIAEIKPDVIKIEFSFNGILLDGTEQQRHGQEHILIYADKIQHVSVGA